MNHQITLEELGLIPSLQKKTSATIIPCYDCICNHCANCVECGLEAGRITDCFQMPESLIPEIYGTIEKKPDGTLYTTKAQRTGCSMCGFGIHMEKRPHRFDLVYESNPKEWDYLMFHMCKDKEGNDYGWAKVLDYIGVGWDPTTIGGNCKGQMRLEDFM